MTGLREHSRANFRTGAISPTIRLSDTESKPNVVPISRAVAMCGAMGT